MNIMQPPDQISKSTTAVLTQCVIPTIGCVLLPRPPEEEDRMSGPEGGRVACRAVRREASLHMTPPPPPAPVGIVTSQAT